MKKKIIKINGIPIKEACLKCMGKGRVAISRYEGGSSSDGDMFGFDPNIYVDCIACNGTGRRISKPNSKNKITRDYKGTIRAQALRDPKFKKALKNEIRDVVEGGLLELSKVMDVSESMRKLDEFKAIKKPKRKSKAYYLQAIKDIKMYYQLSTIKGYKKAGLEGIISTVNLSLEGKPLHYKFRDSE